MCNTIGLSFLPLRCSLFPSNGKKVLSGKSNQGHVIAANHRFDIWLTQLILIKVKHFLISPSKKTSISFPPKSRKKERPFGNKSAYQCQRACCHDQDDMKHPKKYDWNNIFTNNWKCAVRRCWGVVTGDSLTFFAGNQPQKLRCVVKAAVILKKFWTSCLFSDMGKSSLNLITWPCWRLKPME